MQPEIRTEPLLTAAETFSSYEHPFVARMAVPSGYCAATL